MLITKVEKGTGKKYRVYGDEQFVFSLYGKELQWYHIEEGVELQDIEIKDIFENVIYKRAKERALYLLERRPLSTNMLKEKLYASDYPSSVIEKVVAFLEKYHYLDDVEYTKMYVNSYSDKKSRKQIVFDLMKKGIAKDVIDTYFEENEYSEHSCFSKQFERYIRGKNLQDYSTRQKIFCYFYNKGFSTALIDSHIRNAKV